MAAWWTVFTVVVVQGVPFLLLGMVVSAAIGAFGPERVVHRLLPRNPRSPRPSGAAGAVLPGFECASVPVAAFLLSAPAINPVAWSPRRSRSPGTR